jgi:enediyne biosynthesis protein E4
VKLVGVKSNRSAIGARVTARYGGKIQAQEVLSQASFYSANDLRLHFGLGPATTADLDIRWPNGDKETVSKVAADHLVVIKEGSGLIKTEAFRKTPAAPQSADRVKRVAARGAGSRGSAK